VSALVKLRAKLPANEDLNGLDSLIEELINDGATPRAAFLIYDVQKVVEDVATGERSVVIEVRRIEPISKLKEVPAGIRQAVMELADKRGGKQALPFDQFERVTSEAAE
jgi:hypothetical protein